MQSRRRRDRESSQQGIGSILISLANPAASCGECARMLVHYLDLLLGKLLTFGVSAGKSEGVPILARK